MDEKIETRGRPGVFDKSLGKGVKEGMRFPVPVLELLKKTETKTLLDGMAMDDDIKQRAWELGEEWKQRKEGKP
jgi:hypothetical protein